jgi:integrase
MARPKKTDTPDTTKAIELTAGAIERLTCRSDTKAQAFLRDSKAPGLRVRVSNTGAKSFVFEAKLNRQTIRRTIGDVRSWSVEQARSAANRLRVELDNGIDPRETERQQREAAEAEKRRQYEAEQAAAVQAVTVAEVWPRYLAEGRPKRKDAWKPGYRASLELMSSPGGVPKKRGQGNTRPGPLFPLMALALVDVTEDTLQVWFEREAVASKHQAARALMMFRGFLRWCSARPEFRKLTDREAGRAAAIVENLPSNTRRTDALEAAQVPGWWAGVEQLSNRTASAYLRALLLTGARREEMAALKWADVDFQWRKLTIADKVDATRTIPLSPYMAHMLASLPRINAYVYASASKSGRIADVRAAHIKALTEAGIDHLTIHGLRRSFSLLGEASGAPAGAIAQVMGHKPSATAEGYRPRSVDALRPFIERIEAFILEQAGVRFDRAQEPGKLTLVA